MQTWHKDEEASTRERTMQHFVYSGGTHSTSSTLTSAAFATVAFVPEYIDQTATAITYGAATHDVCWTLLSSQNTAIAGWTRVGSTAYYWQCQGGTTPVTPATPAHSILLMQVTVSGSAIIMVRDASNRTPSGTIRDATRYPGATAGAQIASAIASCPMTGCMVDARGFTGTQTLSTDLWGNMTAETPGTLYLGETTFTTTVTQHVPRNWTVECAYAASRNDDGTGAGTRDAGTVFRWAGATSTTIISVYSAHNVRWRGCTIDGANTAGSVGILLDTSNKPPGDRVTFEDWNVYRTAIAVQWGTTGVVFGKQNDGVTFRRFHIVGGTLKDTAKGFVLHSDNAGQYSLIELGLIQLVNMAFDYQAIGSPLRVDNVVFGTLSGTDPVGHNIRSPVGALEISHGQSEGAAVGVNYIRISGAPDYAGSILLRNNRFDELVNIKRSVNIISIGNFGPTTNQCSIDVGVGARILSIGDSFNGGVGWEGCTSGIPEASDLMVLGKKDAGSNRFYPLTLNSGVSERLQLLLQSAAVNPGIGMHNTGAGGNVWQLLFPRTTGVLPGGFVIRDETGGKNVVQVNAGASEGALRIKGPTIQIKSYTYASLPSADDESIVICTDCAAGCRGGSGSPRIAIRASGTWTCP
jgi:hypothetical protein